MQEKLWFSPENSGHVRVLISCISIYILIDNGFEVQYRTYIVDIVYWYFYTIDNGFVVKYVRYNLMLQSFIAIHIYKYDNYMSHRIPQDILKLPKFSCKVMCFTGRKEYFNIGCGYIVYQYHQYWLLWEIVVNIDVQRHAYVSTLCVNPKKSETLLKFFYQNCPVVFFFFFFFCKLHFLTRAYSVGYILEQTFFWYPGTGLFGRQYYPSDIYWYWNNFTFNIDIGIVKFAPTNIDHYRKSPWKFGVDIKSSIQ